MALTSQASVNVVVSSDSAQQNVLLSVNFSKLWAVLAEASCAQLLLAAAASDVAFNFQSVGNGQLVLLKSDSEFQVKVNGNTAPAITCKPRTATDGSTVPAFMMLVCDSVTSLHLSNPSLTETASVSIGVFGDAA